MVYGPAVRLPELIRTVSIWNGRPEGDGSCPGSGSVGSELSGGWMMFCVNTPTMITDGGDWFDSGGGASGELGVSPGKSGVVGLSAFGSVSLSVFGSVLVSGSVPGFFS